MAKQKIHIAEVVKHGDKLVVPESLEYLAASEILIRKHEEEETIVGFSYDIPVTPYEGALALQQALVDVFGYAQAQGSWFSPPQEIAVDVALNVTKRVPWGVFSLPIAKNGHEYVETDTAMLEGRRVFRISGEVKRKWLPKIERLVERVKEIVAASPLYRGKAFTIDFEPRIPTVKFLDLSQVDTSEIVFTKELTGLIESNVLTLIKNTAAVVAAGIPLKRGVLLAGEYGTGKSLLARGIAKTAEQHGWTFVYLKDATQLPHAIYFAKALGSPAVIFGEDIDRQVSGGRTSEMDAILNTLDGIDTKTTQIMVVLTTNHLDQINPAMLRPGRLDVILKVTPPDAEAVQRLVAVYARGRLESGADLTAAGALLDGYTAAVVREVVERAKLMTIARTGSAEALMSGEDVAIAAQTMVQQQALLVRPVEQANTWEVGMVRAVAENVTKTLKSNGLGTMLEQVDTMQDQVAEIHSATT